jgi:hypothetical protein
VVGYLEIAGKIHPSLKPTQLFHTSTLPFAWPLTYKLPYLFFAFFITRTWLHKQLQWKHLLRHTNMGARGEAVFFSGLALTAALLIFGYGALLR